MISGIQKLSLVDYPKYPAYVIFLGGCNFACPFCHNKKIVEKNTVSYQVEDILDDIKNRLTFINGIVVTGGEPTIYGNKLIDLLQQLRGFPLKIKLDTNGSNPKLIKQIIDLQLVDYIAMDIKNTFTKYPLTIGVNTDIAKIRESINIIENSKLDYEFRTTVNKKMHSIEDIEEIKTYLKDKNKLFIQLYRYSEEQLVAENYGEYQTTDLEVLALPTK